MIMIIFIIIIHAGSAEGQVVAEEYPPSYQHLLFRMRLPAFFQRGGEFAGVNPIQSDTFSGRLNILWSECNE